MIQRVMSVTKRMNSCEPDRMFFMLPPLSASPGTEEGEDGEAFAVRCSSRVRIN